MSIGNPLDVDAVAVEAMKCFMQPDLFSSVHQMAIQANSKTEVALAIAAYDLAEAMVAESLKRARNRR